MRFILFGFNKYYPAGGACDIRGFYDTEELALQAAVSILNSDHCYQVFDTDTKTIIKRGSIVGLLSARQEPSTGDD